MRIHFDPRSTTCRPLMLFAHDHPELDIEWCYIDLLAHEHETNAFTDLAPNQAVPFLQHGSLAIGECSAILKYLADIAQSPTYPRDLVIRARVNAAMDWLNTGFYRDFGYNFVYPQVLPAYRWNNPQSQADLLAWGAARSKKWLSVMNDHMLASNDWLASDELTIADFMGVSYVTLGEWAEVDILPFARVAAWVERMKARSGWSAVHAEFDTMRDALTQSRTAPIKELNA